MTDTPVTTTPAPLGIDSIESILDDVVELIKDYKSLQPGDSTGVKVSKFLPALMVTIGSVGNVAKVWPQLKDIDDTEIETLSAKYASKFGADGKVAVYVKEGATILASVFKMIKAK
jgi:hypothetical protein